ncbi:alpha/beta fold hydrolase [Nocardiopsis sp. FIRDI 009]|uniref:thioesterase domain-containing protein n=1 Tax=Nocardiopsis sp. FIRDI 009 TaxID=714197 RepID=UPI000E22E4E2|nr:alpha/beta fold hydrolase [Nocardiopsis sp. FIRDI 009]
MIEDGEVERRLARLSPRQREEFVRLLRTRRRSGEVAAAAPARGTKLPENAVSMREGDHGPPVVFVHSANGTVFPYFPISEALAEGPPVLGLQAPGIDSGSAPPSSLAEVVDGHVAAVRAITGSGPCHLVGWSTGGSLAYAVACALRAEGLPVETLVLLDSLPPENVTTDRAALLAYLAESFALTLGGRPPGLDPDALAGHSEPERLAAAADALVRAGCVHGRERGATIRRLGVGLALMRAGAGWTPPAYDGDLHLVTADRGVQGADAVTRWGARVSGRVTHHTVPGDHYGMMRPPAVDRLAEVLDTVVAGTATESAHVGGVRE